MTGKLRLLFVVFALIGEIIAGPDPLDPRITEQIHDEAKCYDESGKAQRCIPPFENAAFNLKVEATNTCGENDRPTEFCKQAQVKKKSCNVCSYGDHVADYLTDHDINQNATWWQSETMFEGIDSTQVNLTLRLGKTFDITYVRVLFESPRPESWSFYRRKNDKSNWEPYQYYSATCRDTYNLPDSKETVRGDDTRVLCTSEFSDISPLTQGIVAFSTLEGRPSAYQFDTNPALQEWVQATDLRITLDRLNTFGDEVFGDESVLKSYYYAIADIAVGARCSCHGHAGECLRIPTPDNTSRRICRCEHNTAGPDCNECLPFYNDAPWSRATLTDAHECKACSCNGYSDRCYFDKELYTKTGHGGHCIDCKANRDGANCEKCRENYYERLEDNYCVACNCDEIGSRSLQCNSEGKCQCKPGITGVKCDRCESNYYNFDSIGCTSCECDVKGSYKNIASCDSISGTCRCKENVEGKRCRECRPGYFNLALDNEFGCTPCFCYGHSSICSTANGYSKAVIESMFVRSNEKWTSSKPLIPVKNDLTTQTISVTASTRDNIYFIAPERYLGDQRASYNQDLHFTLRIDESEPTLTPRDIIIEGANGEQLTQSIIGQNNYPPTTIAQHYRFRLNEHKNYGWEPHLSAHSFISILSNLTSIKIRGTYTNQGTGYLDNVVLETAQRGAAGETADWVENCQCTPGYIGQFCESCRPGFHHDPPNGGPFSLCVPCNCNGHADICEAETGQCICQHNTAGSNCELCSRGYYGYPLKGTQNDCQSCPCPDNGPCILIGNNPDPICTECPIGRTGPRCEICSDGYFGNPDKGISCRPCECNNNIDLNAVRNCNHETGQCLKCVNNTAGFHCEDCLSGYWGDALSEIKNEGCKLCQCNSLGTNATDDNTGNVQPCDRLFGHCTCKSHVTGRNCDKCEDGYYDIDSNEGCKACNCHPDGSFNRTCDLLSGQCQCRPGITGLQCDSCMTFHYGFGRDGCKHCDCDNIGSKDLQCDANGQCPCLSNVEGRKCDRCKENKYNRQYKCEDCPDCYNLVQLSANQHRKRLSELELTLKKINLSPTVIKNSTFDDDLLNVETRVKDLLKLTKIGLNNDNKTLVEQIDDLKNQLNQIDKLTTNINATIDSANRTTQDGLLNIIDAETILDNIHEKLKNAEDYLATVGVTALNEAKRRANEVGQQNQQMTNIAQEARLIADGNTNEAKKIHQLAEQAKNTSLEAYNLAKYALSKYSNISEEIRELENKFELLKHKYNDVNNLTAESFIKSSNVVNEALYLSTRDLTIPDIDISILQLQIENINKESLIIKERAQLLIQNNDNLFQEMLDKIDNTEKLLNKTQVQQEATADLLSEIDISETKANEAIERSNKTLNEAQETLKRLKEFDVEVQRERTKAQKSIEKINEIRDMIDEAIKNSNNTQIELDNAENNVIIAEKNTDKAQKIADAAGTIANNIYNQTNKTKAEAWRLNNEVENVHMRVENTEKIVKEHESKIGDDFNETTNVNHQVGQTRNKFNTAGQQVDKALTDVSTIIKELKALPEINDRDLDELEKRLISAENEIKQTNLDERIRLLTEAKNLQTQWVKNYEDEVARLKIEVQNIEEIKNSLPNECFKRLQLEP